MNQTIGLEVTLASVACICKIFPILEESASDSEDIEEEYREGVSGDAHGWNSSTLALNISEFITETGPNVTVTNDSTQLAFFYQLFKEETFDKIAE